MLCRPSPESHVQNTFPYSENLSFVLAPTCMIHVTPASRCIWAPKWFHDVAYPPTVDRDKLWAGEDENRVADAEG